MLDWFDGVAGPDYVRAIVWTLLALVVLVIVLVIVKLIRSMTFGTFVAGGRNRKTRLAVMDATAVDSHRRLVLVRRDDIEHLLLIGGPTDVVVERDIRLAAPRRPTLTGGGQETAPARKPSHAQVAPPPAPPPAAPPRHPARAATPPAPPPYPRATAGVSPPAYPAANPRHAARTEPKPAPAEDAIDSTFVNELEASLDDFSTHGTAARQRPEPASPDDEMAKLLGELASHKR